MKRLVFLCGCLALLVSYIANAQKISAEQLLFNSSQGREFWLAIPPNEDDRQPYNNTEPYAIEIYVTSSKNCVATLEIPGLGIYKTKKVEAFKITVFSTETGDLNWDLEVRQSEQPVYKAIHLTATEPISAYVLNHRHYTADGYLAIPISSCGTDYIHLSYYDFYENNAGGEYRGNGFLIIPSEDRTDVFIELKGKGKGIGKTYGGKTVGDKWRVTLNKGEVYCVMGDGSTRGVFDLSGSRIVANKPIGFISFHKRTLIPSFDLWNGRNMLTEMIPPVTAWGKKYYTVEFLRKGRGDFFRIVASKDSTVFTVKWYDAKDGKFLGQRGPQVLKKAGDFAEFEEVYVPRNTTNTLESIKGTSVWEANKPVLVMQYSYSTDWDNAPEFDPFMILVVPREQYVPSTVFQTPAGKARFLDNYFNIIAIGDTNDPSNAPIRSLKLDGKPIWQMEPKFPFNRIPGTDLYWAKLQVQPGPHVVKGNTKFGGYIYGFSDADGYGWPAATAFNKVDETDTLPPEIYVTENCGVFTIRTTELRNGQPDDDPRQIDQGVNDISLLDGSYNFEIKFIKEFKTFPPLYDYTFIVQVVDKKKPGLAYLQIIDRAGNFAFDTLSFYPDSIEIAPNPIVFGNTRLFTTKYIDVQVKNTSDTAKKIKEIRLQRGSVFSIVSGAVPPEIELPDAAIQPVQISYSPVSESTNPTMFDLDTLVVITECDTFKVPLSGRGIIPKILVEDWDAGVIPINNKICKNQQTGTGLKIQNVGSDTLIIDQIEGVTPPFSLSTPFTPPLNIIIPPGGTVYLETPCFAPQAVGNYSIDVIFHSNSMGIDSISNWRGVGVEPGPYITSYDWQRRRVGTSNEGKIFLRNAGSSKVRVTDIKLGTNSPHFRIKPGGIVPLPSPQTPVDLMPDTSSAGVREIEITVIYEPQGEFDHTNTVIPEFHPDDFITPGSVVGNLHGYGYLPKITIRGYEFQPAVLVGTQHPDIGNVVIKSVSQSSDLFIESINWSQNTLNEFQWVTPPPSKFTLRMGDSLVLPVTFTPRAVNMRSAIVEVVNDASPAPDSIITTDTVVIGYGIEKGIVVDSINYGVVLLCDEPIKQFTISNTSSTTEAVIDSVVFVAGDVSNFEIQANFPIVIPKQSSIKINVQFKPDKVGNYSALLRVYSDVEGAYYVLLVGSTYTVPVRFDLPDYGPELMLAPGFYVVLRTNITSTSWRDANITSFEYDIVYETDWLKYISIEKGGILDDTWNITANELKIDDVYSKLHIQGSGTNPINQNGTLVEPKALLLLSDAKSFVPKIENITFHSRDKCVISSPDSSTIVINTCVVDLRPVVVGTNLYFIEVDQNPVSTNGATVRFGVAFDGNAKIDLINMTGNVVETLVNDEMKSGIYNLQLDTRNLSAGVYALRFFSGGYAQTLQFVVTK